jgi:copper chaperone
MVTKIINIDGMSCGHCVMAVRKELSKIPEVFVEEVQIGKAVVKYDDTKIKDEVITGAVEEAGYHVTSIK